MKIQAPPNLSPDELVALIGAGINDWGGVSPVTPDYVNPEAPWPHLRAFAGANQAGKALVERLAIYPAFARRPLKWLGEGLRKPVYDLVDGEGWPRVDDWRPGRESSPPPSDLGLLRVPAQPRVSSGVRVALARVERGELLAESDIVELFQARRQDFAAVCRAADDVRRNVNGDIVSYVVTRNINYTNICSFKCQFCAPFRRASLARIARPPLRSRIEDHRRSLIAGLGARARRKSACRAVFTPPILGAPFSTSAGRSGRAFRGSTCMLFAA